MLDGDEWKYGPKEGPEEYFARMQKEQEESDQRAIEELLSGLTPADSHRPLVSYGEQVTWQIKRQSKRKRSE